MAWAGRDLIVLQGGSKDGWWYFADRVRAALSDPDDARGLLAGYSQTPRRREHPHYAVLGTVWAWTG